MPRAGVQNAAACTARVSMLSGCSGGTPRIAVMISRRRERAPPADDARPAARLRRSTSMPQMPQPVGPGDMAPPLAEPIGAAVGRATSAARCRRRARRCRACSISSGDRDDAFAEAEADREILEIARRPHHHGIGAAIVGQRDRASLPGSRAAPSLTPPSRQICRCDASRPDRAWPYSAASAGGDAAANGAPARHRPSASRSGRWTAIPAPPSPCIPGSWWPSRNSRW